MTTRRDAYMQLRKEAWWNLCLSLGFGWFYPLVGVYFAWIARDKFNTCKWCEENPDKLT